MPTPPPPRIVSCRWECYLFDMPSNTLFDRPLYPLSLVPFTIFHPPSLFMLSPHPPLWYPSPMGYPPIDSFGVWGWNFYVSAVRTLLPLHTTSQEPRAVGGTCASRPSTCILSLCLPLVPVLFSGISILVVIWYGLYGGFSWSPPLCTPLTRRLVVLAVSHKFPPYPIPGSVHPCFYLHYYTESSLLHPTYATCPPATSGISHHQSLWQKHLWPLYGRRLVCPVQSHISCWCQSPPPTGCTSFFAPVTSVVI